jgi:hypothetical protein
MSGLLCASVIQSRVTFESDTLVLSRKLFLDHSWQYGLNVTPEKRDALSRGDTSGIIVHPVLVDVCQLLGYLLANHASSETWVYFQGQTDGKAEQALIIFCVLQSPDSKLDLGTEIQVYSLLLLYYVMNLAALAGRLKSCHLQYQWRYF